MSSIFKKQFLRKSKTHKRDIPIYLFCYHKVGTVLLAKVFKTICEEFGWRYRLVLGKREDGSEDADVVLYAHSLVDFNMVKTPFVGAHFIRDPRDVIVSGYLYHKRTNEEWCNNTNFDLSEPILYPRVPYSQEYRSEEWKRLYILSLGEKSYQQNLLALSQTNGLLFEMCHYGAWTIENMLNWNYNNPSIEEVKFETLINNFDETWLNLFNRFEFSKAQKDKALQITAREDLNRMTDKKLQENEHISSRKITKWISYFEDVHKTVFKQKFGDILLRLEYEVMENW